MSKIIKLHHFLLSFDRQNGDINSEHLLDSLIVRLLGAECKLSSNEESVIRITCYKTFDELSAILEEFNEVMYFTFVEIKLDINYNPIGATQENETHQGEFNDRIKRCGIF